MNVRVYVYVCPQLHTCEGQREVVDSRLYLCLRAGIPKFQWLTTPVVVGSIGRSFSMIYSLVSIYLLWVSISYHVGPRNVIRSSGLSANTFTQ